MPGISEPRIMGERGNMKELQRHLKSATVLAAALIASLSLSACDPVTGSLGSSSGSWGSSGSSGGGGENPTPPTAEPSTTESPETPTEPDPTDPEPGEETPPDYDPTADGNPATDLPPAAGDPDTLTVNPEARKGSEEESTAILDTQDAEDPYGTKSVPAETVSASSLTPGTVLSFLPTEELPHGALVKVTAVEDDRDHPGHKKVTTEKAELTDVITETAGLTELPSQITVNSLTPGEGVEVTDGAYGGADPDGNSPRIVARTFGPQMEISPTFVDKHFTADLKGNLPGVEAANVGGSVRISSLMRINVSAGLTGVKVEEAGAELKAVAEAHMDFEAMKAFSSGFSKDLFTMNYSQTFMAGPVPIVFVVEAKLPLEVFLSSSGSFRYQPKIETGIKVGLWHDGGTTKPVMDRWFNSSNLDHMNFKAGFDSDVAVSPQFNASLYDSIGINGGGKLSGKFEMTTSEDNPTQCSFTASSSHNFALRAGLFGWARTLRGTDDELGRWDNLCGGSDISEPDPVEFDPDSVVPRGGFRNWLNRYQFNRANDLDHPISQSEMEQVWVIDNRFEGGGGDLDGLQYAKNLSYLHWNGDNTSEFRIPDLSGLSKLTTIQLFGEFRNIPAGAGNFPALKDILLNPNTEVNLPGELFAGGRVEVLKLSADRIEIPENINNSPLREIDLSAVDISDLPETFGSLSSLRKLSINSDEYGLENLPESFGNLYSLQELKLSYAGISRLPDSFGNLYNLRDLNISNLCNLGELPSSFGKLRNLESLSILNTGIKSLPENFGELSKLQDVIIKNHTGLSLDGDWSGLTSLRNMDISNNVLTSVPDSIQHMPALESLDISSNPIRNLPSFLGDMARKENGKLYGLNLRNTPVTEDDPVVQDLRDAGTEVSF